MLGPKISSQAAKDQLKDRARRFSRGENPPAHGLRSGRRLLLQEIFSFFKDIASGLAHLHANGYVHRDLKPQNCLLHRTGNTVRALVSDFGEMQGSTVPRRPTATGYTGTISFAAPEVVSRDHNGAFGNFTDKSDVFSLGMVVFFMCFGRLPYRHADLEEEENENLAQLKAEILAWTGLQDERQERTDLPEKLYGFLQLLLSHDPAERPSTESILQGIRAGSAFSEQSASSPIKERYHSPDLGHEMSRPSSSQGDTTTLKRRANRAARPNMVRAGASNNTIQERRNSSHERRTPSSPSLVTESPASSSRTRDGALANTKERGRFSNPLPMLLPPPERTRTRRWQEKIRHSASQPQVVRLAKLSLFFVKAWTLLRPCAPRATHPLVAYPLLVVAALDLVGFSSGAVGSLVSAIIHVVVVFYASHRESLCQHTPSDSWSIS